MRQAIEQRKLWERQFHYSASSWSLVFIFANLKGLYFSISNISNKFFLKKRLIIWLNY
jgi:hypothetical protein